MVVKKSINWPLLWHKLRTAAEAAGDSRVTAVLDNHVGSKESICRRLGIVTEADVARHMQERAKKKSVQKKKA